MVKFKCFVTVHGVIIIKQIFGTRVPLSSYGVVNGYFEACVWIGDRVKTIEMTISMNVIIFLTIIECNAAKWTFYRKLIDLFVIHVTTVI